MATGRGQASPRVSAKARVEALVSELLRGASGRRGRSALAAWRKPEEDLKRLFARNYVRDLRRLLGYRELLALIAKASEIWPRLNRESVNIPQPARMAEMAAVMHLHFKAAPYRGPEGLALRGFYVDHGQNLLKRPLVYVNTAHHPVAVVTTFCHEIGHHMASDIFRGAGELVHLFVDADYAAHLDDSTELAADVIVALAAYPEPLARKIFGCQTPLSGLVAQAGALGDEQLEQVRERVEGHFGVNFKSMKSAPQKLRYLAGMIHFAKLRWALLEEFDT